MVINDIMFRTHLNYQIQATEEPKEQPLNITEVQGIDLHRCIFADFYKAMSYIRDHNPDYNFSDFSISAVKPSGFKDNQKYDFVELTDYAKHTAITIGNMTLFSELQKIASAAEQFNFSVSTPSERKHETVLSFQDYDNYFISETTGAFKEELGSCVIGGGNTEAIKLTATFHDSSTEKRPIISVRAFSLGTRTYLPNIDIINLQEIYKANASLMEVFAYMSYMDHQNEKFNHSFDKLLFSGSFSIDSLDDMYAQHYNLGTFDYLNQ